MKLSQSKYSLRFGRTTLNFASMIFMAEKPITVSGV